MKILSHSLFKLISSVVQIFYGLKLLGVIPNGYGASGDYHNIFGGILLFSGVVGLFTSRTEVSVPINLSESETIEIKGLILAGQKIEAIKRVRTISGCGLKNAKNFVETIEK
jgi:hypothetical protein